MIDKDEVIAALDRAAARHLETIGFDFHQRTLEAGADHRRQLSVFVQLRTAVSMLIASNAGAHRMVEDLMAPRPQQQPQAPPPAPEDDESFRLRLLSAVGQGSVNRPAAESARGAQLDEIGARYDVKRKLNGG